MKAFKIGRSRRNDVVIDHGSVSREHAELIATDTGRYHLTDCGSANGTYRRKKGAWSAVRQEFVAPDEPILLGEYETTPRKLALGLPPEKRALFVPPGELAVIEAALPPGERAAGRGGAMLRRTPQDDLPSGKVERDPETGAVIRSRE